MRARRPVLALPACACLIVAVVTVAVAAAVLAAAWRGTGASSAGASSAGERADARAADLATPAGRVVIGQCTTTLDDTQVGRRANVALAARVIDGVVVEPGAEFSFNRVVGERTTEAGYVDARVIVDGRNQPGLAGGICQVSSTLYNAALLAGMEITERHAHSRPVPYLPPGRDATVAYGSLDLRFTNPLDFPVTVRAGLEGSGAELSVAIEAAEGSGAHASGIRLVSEIVEVIEPRPAGEPGPTGRPIAGAPMAKGQVVDTGQPGYRVRVWAEWEDSTSTRHRELVSYDFYEPVSAVAR